MFDPTIFDNLKVVLEGRMYDLDAEGAHRVMDREDTVDLAAMSRRFRMAVEREGGRCRAVISLTAGMTDFVAERRIARIADHRPGAELVLSFELPASYQSHSLALDAYFRRLWGEEARIGHELISVIEPSASQLQPQSYRIVISFVQKLDESHMEELEQWVDIVAMGLAHIDTPSLFQ